MDDDNLLAQEYGLIQKIYEDTGARALTVKAWSVTFSATGLGLAYTSGERIVLLFAAAGALTFWFVEALIKAHQKSFMPRIEAIEEHFRREKSLKAPFQINSAWEGNFRKTSRVWRVIVQACHAHVMLPHLVIAILGVALFFLCPPGKAEPDHPASEFQMR